jgi:hypothetical protein
MTHSINIKKINKLLCVLWLLFTIPLTLLGAIDET